MSQSTPESSMKLLAVLLKDRHVASRFFESGNSSKVFDDPSLIRICKGISWSVDEGKPLTRDRFEHFLRVVCGEAPAAVAGVLGTFDALRLVEVDVEDYDHLLKQVRDQFLQREFRGLIRELKDSENPSFLSKLGDLSDRLARLVSTDSGGIFEFFDTKEVYDSYITKLKDRAQNPEARITCGIREIDDCMTVGFRPGTLTLTVADVGGGKSTMMLNIAFNLFKRGHNVLFLPLEMPFEDIYAKFLSRECMLEFEKIAKPELLTSDEWQIIESHSDKIRDTRGGLMWADVKSLSLIHI
jgi:replicative DNA helicase